MDEIKRIKGLFEEIEKSIKTSRNNVDDKYLSALDILQNCEGKIIISGVGKSGHIASKVAASYSSTGNPAIFLDPIHALHGDLGIVEGKDVLILLSHSGNTEELLRILPSIKNLGNKIISITSNDNSKLAPISDVHINSQVQKEICPHNLAPTTSTIVTMTILDVLMVLLMERKGFKKESFALFHPAGTLGKTLVLKVGDLINSEIFYCTLENSIIDLINVTNEGKKGLVPIVDDNLQLIGVVTDGDLRRAMNNFGEEIFSKNISQIMTANPKSIDASELAINALNLMEDSKINAIVVLENRKLKGVIDNHDVLQSGLK